MPTFLETLTSSDLGDEVKGLAVFLEGISVKELPMRENALGEGKVGGSGTYIDY